MSTVPNDPNVERLASIRRRISNIRAALEDPSFLTEIQIDGVAEKMDRRALREELRELETEEALLTGTRSRIYGVSFNG